MTPTSATPTLKPNPNNPIIAFNGAITTHVVPHSHRAFAFSVTFLSSLWPLALRSRLPPLHFHPYQEEYIEVLQGQLCVEVEGRERVIKPGDGEICIKPWAHHRLYPPPDFEEMEIVSFLLSGQDTKEVFKLDTVFFQNWYGYQDEVILGGKSMDLIQVMCMFDAGGSYLSLPSWVAFGRSLSVAMGIVVGRWIGGLLGYQPFYSKWSTDWELACQKMETSFLQKRFADRTKTT